MQIKKHIGIIGLVFLMSLCPVAAQEKAFYNIDNDFPKKSVNIAPVIGAAIDLINNLPVLYSIGLKHLKRNTHE